MGGGGVLPGHLNKRFANLADFQGPVVCHYAKQHGGGGLRVRDSA